jgi:hypothetical protein
LLAKDAMRIAFAPISNLLQHMHQRALHDEESRTQLRFEGARLLVRCIIPRSSRKQSHCVLHEAKALAILATAGAFGLSSTGKPAMGEAVLIANRRTRLAPMHAAAPVRHRRRFAGVSSTRFCAATGRKRHAKPARIPGFLTVHGIEPRFVEIV